MERDSKGRIKPTSDWPSTFKDDHDGISPIETFHGTRYLLKWPDYTRFRANGQQKWHEEVDPWLRERDIKIAYHNSRSSIMLPTMNDALLFKLSWDPSDFK